MEQNEEPVKVIFRKWPDGEILALFPDLEAGYPGLTHMVLSCQHIGQHSSADYWWCIKKTRPAKPEEYAALKKELELIGYKLIVRQRRSYR